MKQYWFLILTFFCSCIQAQTYEALRDSGQVLFDALRYDAAITQWEGAQVLAEQARQKRQLQEIQSLISTASELRLTALQQLKGYFFSDANQEAVSWAYDFSSGKFRIIDRQGRPVSAPIWQNPEPFSEGIALAQQGGYQYLVDQAGRLRSDGYLFLTKTQKPWYYGIKMQKKSFFTMIITAPAAGIPVLSDWQGEARTLSLNQVNQPDSTSYLCVKNKEGLSQILNIQGEALVKDIFQDAIPFSPDLICVKKADLWGLMDLNGHMKQAFQYQSIRPLVMGFSPVQQDDTWGFLDPEGNVHVPCQYEAIRPYDASMAAFREGGIWGFLDKKGKEVIPASFIELRSFINQKAWVQGTDGWQLIDQSGKALSQGAYFSIERLNGSFTDKVETDQALLASFWQVKQDEQWGLHNEEGEQILPVRFSDINWIAEHSVKTRSGDTLRVWTYDPAKERFQQMGKHYGLLSEAGTYIYSDRGKRLTKQKTSLTRWSSEGLMAYKIGSFWYAWRGSKDRFVKMPSQWSVSHFAYGFAVTTEYQWNNKKGEHVPTYSFLDVNGEELQEYIQIEAADFSADIRASNPPDDVSLLIKGEAQSYWLAPVHDISLVQQATLTGAADGYTFIERNGKMGVLDEQGQVFIPATYDSLSSIGQGEWLYRDADQFGFIAPTGQPYFYQTAPDTKITDTGLLHTAKPGYIPITFSDSNTSSGFQPFSFPRVEANNSGIRWDKNTGNIIYSDSTPTQTFGYQGFQQKPYIAPKPIVSISKELEEGLDLSTKTGPEIVELLFKGERSIPQVYFTQGGKEGYMLLDNSSDSSVYLSKFLPVEYDQIEVQQEHKDWVPVQQNGKWGFVHWEYQADLGYHRGVLRIPCIYDAVSPFQDIGKDLLARVYLDAHNLMYYINTEGEMMVSP